MEDKTRMLMLVNFTKGYGQVPVDLYDLVLPLIKEDMPENDFRSYLASFDESFKKGYMARCKAEHNLCAEALALAMVNKYLRFDIFNKMMVGLLGREDFTYHPGAYKLGRMLRGQNREMIISYFIPQDFKIIFLDSNTLGNDIDLSLLDQFGQVELCTNISQDSIKDRIRDVDCVLVNKMLLGKEELQGSRVKLIVLTSTGTNVVDLNYCFQQGITVCNAANYSTSSVALHTMMLYLALNNRLLEFNDYIYSRQYSMSKLFTSFDYPFKEAKGKTWGIVGMGAIGQEVARLAESFGMKVQYYSTTGNNNEQRYSQVDFKTLLRTSDVISLHCPLNDQNRNLFTLATFNQMRKEAILINVARGGIVNENDLVTALDDQLIQAAGLDVFSREPLPEDSPLLRVKDPKRLLLTPHVAWASQEARQLLFKIICDNIAGFKRGDIQNSCGI